MIKKIKRKNIDLNKYTACLNRASNYRIYAESWYLDALTNKQWDCLVYGDYEAIMPIPYQRKLGIKLVIMPIYCQQLGVFYNQEITDDLFKQFEKKLHRMLIRSYCFNEENTEKYKPKGELRVNHILDLNKPYEEIYKKNYNRNRRRKLIDLPDGYELKSSESIDDFIILFQKEYPNLAKKKWVKHLKHLMQVSFKKEIGLQIRIEHNNQLVGSLFYIKTHTRIFQLGAARDKKITDIGFFTIIIDYVVKIHSNNSKLKFDFEGSSVKGIANFNESFGAKKKCYTLYKNITKF